MIITISFVILLQLDSSRYPSHLLSGALVKVSFVIAYSALQVFPSEVTGNNTGWLVGHTGLSCSLIYQTNVLLSAYLISTHLFGWPSCVVSALSLLLALHLYLIPCSLLLLKSPIPCSIYMSEIFPFFASAL